MCVCSSEVLGLAVTNKKDPFEDSSTADDADDDYDIEAVDFDDDAHTVKRCQEHVGCINIVAASVNNDKNRSNQ